MTNQLTVNEFSRKLLEPKKVQDKWVSTGFDKEIGFITNANLEVPLPIQEAVNNHYLRINDSYPPAEGEIALIAKEIDKYAILVVANGWADDSDRPFVGYRYFWLENPSETEIDVVGTLLKWWLDHDKPCFELKPHQEIKDTRNKNHREGYYKANALSYHQESFEEYRQQAQGILADIKDSHFKSVRNKFWLLLYPLKLDYLVNTLSLWESIITQIKSTPYIFTIKEESENIQVDYYLELHSLALYLKQNYDLPIAWVWNVTALENPDQFNLICCADEASNKWNLGYNKVSTPLTQATTITTLPQTINIQATAIINLKESLRRIAEKKNFDSNFNILIEELKKGDSTRWDWGQIIDETWLKTHLGDEVEAKYKALILLLNPNLNHKDLKITPSDWINSIKANPVAASSQRSFSLSFSQPQKPSSPVNQYTKSAVDLQCNLINSCYQYPAIVNQLKPRIDEIISQLLLSLRTKTATSDEDYKVIEWLLCDSSESWRSYLVYYADDLFDKLARVYKQKQELNQNETDAFLQKILEDLEIKQKTPSTNLSLYKQIAQILEKIKAYPIAAFFYQLSTDDVPDNLRRNCTNLPKIISLKKKEIGNISSEESINKKEINFNLISWILLSAIIGTGLGIGLETWLKFGNRFLYSPMAENKSEIITSDPVRELYLYLNLLETGDLRKDMQAKNIQSIDSLIKKIPSPNDEKFKTQATREELLKEQNKLIKSPLYSFIKQLTPTVKVKLDKTYQANQVNVKTPLKSPEIQLAKAILKQPLGIYKDAINLTWDQDTSDVIKEFQKQYEIKPTEGTLDNNTWLLLSVMIQDQQVKEAAETLKKIIGESKNYQEFKDRYDKLTQCKTPQDKLYSKCLEDIFQKIR